jgi:hypothetical protein
VVVSDSKGTEPISGQVAVLLAAESDAIVRLAEGNAISNLGSFMNAVHFHVVEIDRKSSSFYGRSWSLAQQEDDIEIDDDGWVDVLVWEPVDTSNPIDSAFRPVKSPVDKHWRCSLDHIRFSFSSLSSDNRIPPHIRSSMHEKWDQKVSVCRVFVFVFL